MIVPSSKRLALLAQGPFRQAGQRLVGAPELRCCGHATDPGRTAGPVILQIHITVDLRPEPSAPLLRRHPQLPHLPAAPAIALRRHVTDSPNQETARSLPTLSGVEPHYATCSVRHL